MKFLNLEGLAYFKELILSKIPTKLSELTNDLGYKKVDSSITNGNIIIDDKETTVYTLPNATTSNLGGVKIGSNVSVSNGTISVKDGNTSQKGVVQLTDSTSSTSTTTAATPNSVSTALAEAKEYSNTLLDGLTTDCIQELSVNGTTITYTKGDGTTGTITTQDTNTTYNAAGSALGLVKSGGDVTISSGTITINDDSHNHVISNVDGLQTALDGKSASSHTHDDRYYTESEINAKFDALIGEGASTTLDTIGEISAAIEDNQDMFDTLNAAIGNKANTSALDSHISDTTKHITSTERTNWNAAKTHADSTHAPSNAEKNQNAFSNITIGSTTISADTTTDTLTLVAGSNITLTPDVTNDKVTIAATDTVYTHPTTSGNKHIPSGGSSGQILRWSSDGTAVWGADNNTTYTLSSFGITATAAELNALDGITATVTELNYCDGVTSNIQTQLNGKATSNHTHNYAPAYTYGTSALTAGTSSLATGILYFQYE